MVRHIVIIGAPSSIGIRPYEDGSPRRLDLAPGVLREQGIGDRLGARDLGDVVPPPYRDLVRPLGRPRNESEVASYSRELAQRVGDAAGDGAFILVLGGDCSIVLGCLLGLRRAASAPVGLIYVDAHSDFATPASSRTGSAASMCLALAASRRW
jgi:arginase